MEKIYITKNDYKKLIDLIDKKWPHDENDQNLLLELNRAQIIEPQEIPKDIITMNSKVGFIDLETNKEFEYWLVFPKAAEIEKNKISVLSPIGCALLGYKIGEVISLKTPRGEKKIKVEKILHQPEAAGNF